MVQNNRLKELRILAEGSAEIGASTLIELDCKSFVPIHDLQGSIVTLISDEIKVCLYTAFGECSNPLSP